MATKEKAADGGAVEIAEKAEKKTAPKEETSVYDITEFAAAAEKMFGQSPDLVTAALLSKGRSKYTKTEAKAAVKAFAEKEVV